MSWIDWGFSPPMSVEGYPGRIRGLNRHGLRRSTMAVADDGPQFGQLQDLWTLIYHGELVLAAALRKALARTLLAAIAELSAFLESSVGRGRRGPLPAYR